MIELKNICKSYGDNHIIKNLNLTINDNEKICIMGESGSGKTTLLRLILNLEKPDSGKIISVNNYAVMFQEDRLLPNLTALGNIKITTNKSENEILKALDLVGINGEALKIKVDEFSGGMKRRVALVRAMLYDASAVILDEPFKGLDDDTKILTQNFINQNIGKRIFVCITHDYNDADVLNAKIVNLSKINE